MVFTMTLPKMFLAFLLISNALSLVNAYWLMSTGIIATERLDPIVAPGKVASHVHSIMGGSNFGFTTSTAKLRQSKCTSTPIRQDKSNYWFPHLYFQWANGSFTSLTGGSVVCAYNPDSKISTLSVSSKDYLFSDHDKTTAFPDDFRMLGGDPTLRTYNPSSHAQQAVTFLCLDFHGVSTRHNEIPSQECANGVRAQINMPSCWDGKNVDSPDHMSHVAFPSGGPDSGTCSDPRFPVTIPRIFIEMYWNTADFDKHRSAAMVPSQPFVFSYGDRTGYGYHADFYNGWDAGVLQRAVDQCKCNPNGDPTCCAQAGIFDFNPKGSPCFITPQVDEVATGTIPKLPGNNPVTGPQDVVNGHIITHPDPSPPGALYPPNAYTDKPPFGACAVSGGLGSGCSRGPVPGGAAPAPSSAPVLSAPGPALPSSPVSVTAPSQPASPPASRPSPPAAPVAPPGSHGSSSGPAGGTSANSDSSGAGHSELGHANSGSTSNAGSSSSHPAPPGSSHSGPTSGSSNSAYLPPAHSNSDHSSPGHESGPGHSSAHVFPGESYSHPSGHHHSSSAQVYPGHSHSHSEHSSSGNHSGVCRAGKKHHAGKHKRRNIH